MGTVGVMISLLTLGWTKEIASIFVSDTGPNHRGLTIFLAVLAIYLMDFAVNAVQACARSLVVDTLPASLMEEGSAWTSRMVGFGAVASFYIGFVDLVAIFPFAGDSQLKVFALLSGLVLCSSAAITCWAVSERVLLQHSSHRITRMSLFSVVASVWQSMRTLPKPIQAVCNIQFCAWIGWFPILFYSTTWIGGIFLRTQHSSKDIPAEVLVNEAAREGSFGLLLHSIMALLVSIVGPFIVAMPSNTKSSHLGYSQSPLAKVLRHFEFITDHLPIAGLTLPLAWCISHFFFAFLMLLTWFMRYSLFGADLLIAMTGFPWAMTMWAPLSLIGEFIHEDSSTNGYGVVLEHAEVHGTVPDPEEEDLVALEAAEGIGGETAVHLHGDRTVRSSSSEESGVVLGIQNVYVVLPQFLVTFMSSIIFAFLEPATDLDGIESTADVDDKDAIGLVMRIGGITTAIAGYLTWRLIKSVDGK